MTKLAFVDTETTGLDPEVNEVWEVALILRDPDAGLHDEEHVWQLPVDLGWADPVALRIGRFYERRSDSLFDLASFAADFSKLTDGAHLVGAAPSFDAAFLKPLLARNGGCWGLHYHLVDVEALAAGWIAGTAAEWAACNDRAAEHQAEPPWNSSDLTGALCVKVADEDKHTALGDARWARDLYDAVMGLS